MGVRGTDRWPLLWSGERCGSRSAEERRAGWRAGRCRQVGCTLLSSLPALVLVLHDLGIKYEDCRKMGFCTGDDRDFLESRSARDVRVRHAG